MRYHSSRNDTLTASSAAAAKELGCHAVCLGGSGPSILCMTKGAAFTGRMHRTVGKLAHHWTLLSLKVDSGGAYIV